MMAIIEIFGAKIGTVLQGGMFATLLFICGSIVVWWIKGAPDRRRVENERVVIDNSEKAMIRREFDELNKQNRADIHELRNDLAKAIAAQHKSESALLEAQAVQRKDRSDMDSMMFLIRILISEIKRLDPEPNNKIIEQAEMVLEHMGRGATKEALVSAKNAEHAVHDTIEALERGGKS